MDNMIIYLAFDLERDFVFILLTYSFILLPRETPTLYFKVVYYISIIEIYSGI